jgi:hypothetical protein
MVADTHRVPFTVRPPAGIDDMKDGISLPEVIEKLVSEPLSFMSVRDQPRYIDKIHGNESAASGAVRTFDFEIGTGTFRPDICNPEVRINGCERVIGDLSVRHRGSLEKGRFSAVGFSRKGKGDHGSPQVKEIECHGKIRTESDKAFHPGLLKDTYGVFMEKDLLL